MSAIKDISLTLETAANAAGQSVADLQRATGLNYLTVSNALKGKTDPQVSTLMALAHELGMELVVVPKAVAAQLMAQSAGPSTPSFVDAALGRKSKTE